MGVPADLGARIVQGSLGQIHTDSDPLALPENILYERYRFSSEGFRYLIILVGPYVGNAAKRSRALTVVQCVCVSLQSFSYMHTYLHAVGEAEKNAVCL